MYKSDYYALVYPRNLNKPFVNSPEAAKITLEKSEKTKVFVQTTDYEYKHDYLNISRKCSFNSKPVEQCLYESIDCEPFSTNSTLQK